MMQGTLRALNVFSEKFPNFKPPGGSTCSDQLYYILDIQGVSKKMSHSEMILWLAYIFLSSLIIILGTLGKPYYIQA